MGAAPPAPSAPGARGTDSTALFKEGNALFQKGDVAAALAKYQEAARLNPSDAKTQRQIGYCYNRLGQHERAEPYLRKYLELAPNAADAAFVKAEVGK
jgi:Flp pilus assembly protein TadD